jgi:protein involved in polysaccharide export with SLBB domain
MMRSKTMIATAVILSTTLLISSQELRSDNVNWNFQSGDAVSISTLPDTGFPNGIYIINEHGCVDLPIVGLVNISQTKKDSFDMLIKDTYIGYVKGPYLKTHRLMRISMLGGFAKPGLYWISPEATLWNAVYIAGGPMREDGIARMKWERGDKLIKKGMASDFQSGKTLVQLGFESGDQISVTARQKLTPWEIFIQNVVPVLSLSITAVVAAASLRN